MNYFLNHHTITNILFYFCATILSLPRNKTKIIIWEFEKRNLKFAQLTIRLKKNHKENAICLNKYLALNMVSSILFW